MQAEWVNRRPVPPPSTSQGCSKSDRESTPGRQCSIVAVRHGACVGSAPIPYQNSSAAARDARSYLLPRTANQPTQVRGPEAWHFVDAGSTLRWSRTNGYPEGAEAICPNRRYRHRLQSLFSAPHRIESARQSSVSKLLRGMGHDQGQPQIPDRTYRHTNRCRSQLSSKV